jgi:dephospho-CoA kinase
VSAEYLQWREQLAQLSHPPRVCVTEVPLLYEAGADERFDKVVLVTAPRQLRDARTYGRSAGREERLIPDAKKRDRADYVYVNTGSLEELDAFVADVMRELSPS